MDPEEGRRGGEGGDEGIGEVGMNWSVIFTLFPGLCLAFCCLQFKNIGRESGNFIM